jgi:hypothetical protein
MKHCSSAQGGPCPVHLQRIKRNQDKNGGSQKPSNQATLKFASVDSMIALIENDVMKDAKLHCFAYEGVNTCKEVITKVLEGNVLNARIMPSGLVALDKYIHSRELHSNPCKESAGIFKYIPADMPVPDEVRLSNLEPHFFLSQQYSMLQFLATNKLVKIRLMGLAHVIRCISRRINPYESIYKELQILRSLDPDDNERISLDTLLVQRMRTEPINREILDKKPETTHHITPPSSEEEEANNLGADEFGSFVCLRKIYKPQELIEKPYYANPCGHYMDESDVDELIIKSKLAPEAVKKAYGVKPEDEYIYNVCVCPRCGTFIYSLHESQEVVYFINELKRQNFLGGVVLNRMNQWCICEEQQ